MSEDEKVGYKLPPKARQFQKGRSGNPKGRPKNTRNLKADLADELKRRISVTAHGRAASVTKQQALIMASITRAIKGDMRAATVIFTLVRQLLEPDAQFDDPMMQPSLADQEIVEAFLKRQVTNSKGDGK